MGKAKIAAIALAVVVLLGGAAFLVITLTGDYGDSEETKTEDNIVGDAPPGCPIRTTIVVNSEEAGNQKISTENSNFLHWRDDQGMLIFTNYTLNPDSVYSDITGDRVLTVIKLSHEDKTKLTTGTFSYAKGAEGEVPNKYSPEYNISTEFLAGAVFDDSATVNVTYLGNDYVCGTVDSDDGSSSIKGEFIAKYINKL